MRTLHVGERKGEGAIGFVVHEQVALGHTTGSERYGAGAAVDDHHTLVSVLAEDEWLAIDQVDGVVRAGVLLGGIEPRLMIEDVAVLIDLDEGASFVSGGAFHGRDQHLGVDVDASGHEGAFGGQRDGERVHWLVNRTQRRGLGDLSPLACG
jgi:hypothetical protein